MRHLPIPEPDRRWIEAALQDLHEGRFQRSLAAVTAGSALLAGLEVAYEHYRGSYGNRVMYTPIVLTPPLILAAAWTVASRRGSRFALPAASAAVLASGAVGFLFHIRGIRRKPGGWRLPMTNVVMGPPILAPLLFAIPGYLGLVASFLRREGDRERRFTPILIQGRRGAWLALAPHRRPRSRFAREIRQGRFQRHMAAAAAVSSICSGFEALYSHYKNNFRYKAQWTPVLLAPLLAAAGIGSVFSRRVARTALPVFSALAIANGAVGFLYHGRGVLRRSGGKAHLAYNIMYGPPILAPLLFTAAGFMGLLASLMGRER